MPPEKQCGICRFWDCSLCRRFPHEETKAADDWCGEFRPKLDPEVLATELLLLPTVSARTRSICAKLNLRTVDDLVQVGRYAISTDGRPDPQAIREIKASLERLGIEW
jgi:hypothetical protein